MTFEDMVNKYLPHFDQLDNANVVKQMFQTGLYADIFNAEQKVLVPLFKPNLSLL